MEDWCATFLQNLPRRPGKLKGFWLRDDDHARQQMSTRGQVRSLWQALVLPIRGQHSAVLRTCWTQTDPPLKERRLVLPHCQSSEIRWLRDPTGSPLIVQRDCRISNGS